MAIPKHVFFDLDGTLTDPYEGISKSVIYACEKLGIAEPSLNQLQQFIGPPIQQSFQALLDEKHRHLSDQAVVFYRERFAETGWRENRVFDGIPELLEDLLANDCKACLVTSKPHIYAQKIVDHFQLSRYLTAVYGSELDGRFSLKEELVQLALKGEKATADQAVMVGDRNYDVIGAHAHKVRAIGVLWGFGTREELVKAGAESLCQHIGELRELLGLSPV